MPWPHTIEVSGARTGTTGLRLNTEGPEAGYAARSFAALVAELFPGEPLLASGDGGIPVWFRAVDAGPEDYELGFADGGATVAASTRTGFLYGLVTLAQIVRGARQHPGALPVPSQGTIRDTPALRWRGAHLDCARHFFPVREVMRFLRILAWNKINRFHWHLSDDEGWRVEIAAYPELTTTGAWRGHGLPLPPLLGSGARRTGGYYTKAEIREIVALGRSLGIEIVPEIDVPGHCHAVLESLPLLRDPEETGTYESVQGFANNCLNPGREAVYGFLETVIDELLDLFPAGIVHLGADEVPLAAWSGSPAALDLLERLAGSAAAERHRARRDTRSQGTEADDIGGSGAAILQAHLIGRIHRYLRSKGAKTGGWEEAAHGGVLDKATSYLVGWRTVEVNAALAAQGYDIVASPAQHYYLDMACGPEWEEPGAGWAGWSSARDTYEFDPRAGWSQGALKHLLGVQACLWSERMADPAVFDRLAFPRLSAVAEAGWTQPDRKSWSRFEAFAELMPTMYGAMSRTSL